MYPFPEGNGKIDKNAVDGYVRSEPFCDALAQAEVQCGAEVAKKELHEGDGLVEHRRDQALALRALAGARVAQPVLEVGKEVLRRLQVAAIEKFFFCATTRCGKQRRLCGGSPVPLQPPAPCPRPRRPPARRPDGQT
eukprot:CAMPEP_0179430144 /NCGR_PEP_ID=MMETSP0799-20121207/15371_1 /TAXON_ID=46947 /ORGANISM="Geminigera cryophila, Strain CCMP2564" /LENGTH=136 /DNA_ID=CAMNT_0021206455 /DNA_START=427 /DNA_END=838 /DNA_ORIENTATION=+